MACRHLFPLRVVFIRYALFGLVGLEALLIPFMLAPERFAEIEYFRNLVFLFQFAFLGLCTGYITHRYRENDDQKETLLAGAASLALVATSAVWIVSGSSALAVAVLIVMSAFLIETLLKADVRYTLAILFKPLCSVVYLSLAGIFLLTGAGAGLVEATVVMLICVGAIVGWLPLILRSIKAPRLRPQFRVGPLGSMFKSGLIINLTTLLVMLHLFLDRHFIREAFPDLLPDYSFAMNLAQFVILAITTIGYMNQVEIGRTFQDSGIDGIKTYVGKSLKRTFSIYLILNLLLVPVGIVVQRLIGFDDLLPFLFTTSVLLGAALSLFSINAALAYLRKFNVVAAMLLVTLVANVLLDRFWLVPSSLPYGLILTSYLAVVCVGIGTAGYLWYVLSKTSVASGHCPAP